MASTPSSLSVRYAFEFVHPSNLDRQLLVEAARGLTALPLTGDVTLVVTGQLARSFVGRTAATYGGAFSETRNPAGRVVAKAVASEDAGEILLDALIVASPMETRRAMGLSRLVRHEALHLLLIQHLEDAEHLLKAVAPADEREALLAWAAALALDEYRIELFLCREGSFAARRHSDELETMLPEFAERFASLGARWGSDDCAATAISVTNDLVAKIAFLAAEEAVRPSLRPDLIESDLWRTLVGAGWPAWREVVAEVPDAATEAQPVVVKAVRRLMPVIAAWCERLGFRLEADDQGVVVAPLNEQRSDT